MNCRIICNNFNVLNVKKSIVFHSDAFNRKEVRRVISAQDSLFIIKEPYDLCDDEFDLALRVDNYEAAHARHEKMSCICCENPATGICFVTAPDNYWLEVLPEKR